MGDLTQNETLDKEEIKIDESAAAELYAAYEEVVRTSQMTG